MSERNVDDGSEKWRDMIVDFILAATIATAVLFGSWVASMTGKQELSWLDGPFGALIGGYVCLRLWGRRGCVTHKH